MERKGQEGGGGLERVCTTAVQGNTMEQLDSVVAVVLDWESEECWAIDTKEMGDSSGAGQETTG